MFMMYFDFLAFTFVTVNGVMAGNYPVTKECSSCINENLNSLVRQLNWTSVVIIHDGTTGYRVSWPVTYMIYNLRNVNTTAVIEDIHEVMFPDTNIVLLLDDMLMTMVKQLNYFDSSSKGRTDFHHFSKIIVFLRDTSTINSLGSAATYLENVLLVLPYACCALTPPNKNWEMYTLNIHPHGREFSQLIDVRTADTVTFFPNTQYGYNNRSLVVATLHSPPYVMKRNVNGTPIYEGYAWEIWTVIAKELNISYSVIEPPDGSWGVQGPNGSWNGLVKQLMNRPVIHAVNSVNAKGLPDSHRVLKRNNQNWQHVGQNEADVVVCDLTVVYERAQQIDYIYPAIKVDPTDILYKKIYAYDKSFYRTAKPFNKVVYLVIIALSLVVLVLFIGVEETAHLSSLSLRTFTSSMTAKLPAYITSFLGSAVRQGFQLSVLPYTNTARVLLGSWWLFILIETALYSGNLVASFSADTDTNDISSIDQLVDSDYTVGTYTQSVALVTLQESKRPNLRRLYSKMVDQSKHDEGIFSSDHNAQYQRVRERQHAYIVYKSFGEALASEDCLLDMVGESVTWAEETMTFGIPKKSPLKHVIEKKMSMLKESGLLDIWWRKWTWKNAPRSCEIIKRVKSIDILDVGGVFLVMCGGIFLSCVTLMCEVRQRHKTPRSIIK